MPGYRLTAWLRPLLTLAAMAGVLSLAACGGGGGAPSQVLGGGTTPVTVTPSTATVYTGTPSTFLISGGTKPYTILTSDQTALPVVGTLNGNALVVVPGSVGTDTAVTLSVRDTTGQSTTAAVTVKPQLLLPTSITVTGNTNCAAAGGTLCSGQNGTASVLVIGPNSAPLANRPVRFDVVQGDFAFVNPGGGAPAPSITATTDQNGFAVVTLTVPASATTQIATIRATDLTSGNAISSNFTIVAFNDGSAVLSVVPTTATVKGPPASPPVCAVGAPINYYVFGGTPPYTISLTVPNVVIIRGSPVQVSGGFFTAITNGCVDLETIVITDATGRFTTVTLTSVLGPDSGTGGGGGGASDCSSFSPSNPACPTVGQTTLSLTACSPQSGSTASTSYTEGTTPVTGATIESGSGIQAQAQNGTLTVTRSSGAATSPVTVHLNAGSLFVPITVNVTNAAVSCP